MNGRESAAAERTVNDLQQAAARGMRIMIPGSFERRAVPVVESSTVASASAARPAVRSMSDSVRLDYEREGGGASSERRPARVTMAGRLWHAFRR